MIVLGNCQLHRLDIQRGPHARQCFFQHQHDEQPLLAHLGSLVSNGAPGRTSAKMRSWGKRHPGFQFYPGQRLRAQSLDRIAVDILQDRDLPLPCRAVISRRQCTRRHAGVEPVVAESRGASIRGCAPDGAARQHPWTAGKNRAVMSVAGSSMASSMASDSRAIPFSICLRDSAA